MSTDCLKLTAYFGERARAGDRLVADGLLDLFGRHRIATSVLLRGCSGFGVKHHLRTDTSLTLSEDLPAVAVAVDERARIEALADDAVELAAGGLVTLERARLLTAAHAAPPADELGAAAKLSVYLGRQARVGRTPAYRAVCDLLRRRGVDGASVLLGVDGTAHGERTRARFFAGNSDVPLLVLAVGPGDAIGAALPELRAAVPEALLTLERVTVCKRDGRLLATPNLAPGIEQADSPAWHKLSVYTSETQLIGSRPIHRAVMSELRAGGAAGATTLRGMWGFSGTAAPHGDRLWQLGRRVPTLTITVDSAERAAASFALIDALTTEHGLVTSELVPTCAG